MRFLFSKIYYAFVLCMVVGWIFFAYGLLLHEIPSDMKVASIEEITGFEQLPITCKIKKQRTSEVFSTILENANTTCDSCQIQCLLFGVIPIKEVEVNVEKKCKVYPSGRVVGIYGQTNGVMVQRAATVKDANGNACCPAEGKLMTGDYIYEVNGEEITCKEELIQAVDQSNGEALSIQFYRDGKEENTQINPVCVEQGDYLLGVWVKDDLAGIGTMTFYQEDGSYGALGHGIGDGESKNLLYVSDGAIYEAKVNGVKKSQKGTPGELEGIVYYGAKHQLGTVSENQNLGVFGQLNKETIESFKELDESLEIAYKQEIKKDTAMILSDYTGVREAYEIKIINIDYTKKDSNKCLIFEVTDERLLEQTGGIVQGMSGSPIIQDGKVIGAVTHVFVQEPNRGYGIFIEEML